MSTATETKERPILFSAPMVRAILSGAKTQTRRLVTPQPFVDEDGHWKKPTRHGSRWAFEEKTDLDANDNIVSQAVRQIEPPELIWRLWTPPAATGDRLWVRETWAAVHFSKDWETGYCDDWWGSPKIPADSSDGFWVPVYDADEAWEPSKEERCFNWRPSIHMPRWASRITLDVLSVRVERLQDISQEDARAEGVDAIPDAPAALTHRTAFAGLWKKINGPESWDANPWVWVVEFRRV